MQVFRIASKVRIEPFGDPVGETLILDRPFRELQKEVLEGAGGQVADLDSISEIRPPVEGGYLVVADNLFLSPRLLAEFLEKSSAQSGNAHRRLAVKKGLFTRILAPIQEAEETETLIRFPLWFVPSGNFDQSAAIDVLIDVDEDSYAGHFPKHMIGKDGYRFGVTGRPVVLLTNALHLALANMAANVARLAELKKMSLWQKVVTLAKARSLNKFKVLAAVSSIHPEAEVHPTAVVEGSVVEKGAKIGAYAVIRFSYVGENAFIDDHAGLKFSVIGREAYVANNCVVFFSVVYPRAFLISGPFQFSLFGYDSALMNAIPADYRLDGKTITIRTAPGITRDTGLRFVGSVIGHRTKVAAGVIIAPGRMIPNDLLIFPDPGRVITTVPTPRTGEVPGCSHGGRDASGSPPTTLFLVEGKLLSAEELPRKEKSQHGSEHFRQRAGSHSGVTRYPTRKGHTQSPHHRGPRQ